MADGTLDLPPTSEATWHGSCLAYAELARRGLVSQSRIGVVIEWICKVTHDLPWMQWPLLTCARIGIGFRRAQRGTFRRLRCTRFSYICFVGAGEGPECGGPGAALARNRSAFDNHVIV
jgi:hypothetical protein